ncbi:unnamed protein product, partial [marine sediment metagenome]
DNFTGMIIVIPMDNKPMYHDQNGSIPSGHGERPADGFVCPTSDSFLKGVK